MRNPVDSNPRPEDGQSELAPKPDFKPDDLQHQLATRPMGRCPMRAMLEELDIWQGQEPDF